MGIFNGGLFDFNGDGETSFGEDFLGFMLLGGLMHDEEEERRRRERLDEDDEDDF